MHSSGWMYSIVTDSNSGSSLRGWMQSTGQTSTQAESFVPMQGSVITNGMYGSFDHARTGWQWPGDDPTVRSAESGVAIGRFPTAGSRAIEIRDPVLHRALDLVRRQRVAHGAIEQARNLLVGCEAECRNPTEVQGLQCPLLLGREKGGAPDAHLEADDPILELGRVLPADGNEHCDRRSQSAETDPGRRHSANPAPLHHEFYDGDEKKGAGENRHRRAV